MESELDKETIELEIVKEIMDAAKTKWGIYTKDFINQILNRELIKELNMESDEIKEMKALAEIITEKLTELTRDEVYWFGFRNITAYFSLPLPYTPGIIIEVLLTDKKAYIRYKGKETSRSFRDNLSLALDKVASKYDIRRIYVSIGEVAIDIDGKDDKADLIVYTIKKFLHYIYEELCVLYKKTPVELFIQ